MDNPSNIPKIRPIEHFWLLLSRLVYSDGWESKPKTNFRDTLNRELDVDMRVVQQMKHNIKKILRQIEGQQPTSVV
ncbi:hypothetical protein ILUMI_24804 [Ignelater luminosus]|uniref:Uncharacterized protein n=1 Tax=Ignelater luminosus TaxID=2038154 RepID=A0A8K0C9J6_IGNLU|nr:hypothetical protein ILUMI_24804 [Ignelater luminosus]